MFPETQGFAYSFQSAELNLGVGIFTLISNVQIDQPTTEAAVFGTRPFPLKRTLGKMDLGVGLVTFSDDSERIRFLTMLGPAWREKTWSCSWKLIAVGALASPPINVSALGCRVLSNPFDHAEGEDALGGDIGFSFMNHLINGMAPHSGIPMPTR